MKRFFALSAITGSCLALILTPTLGQQPVSSQQELVNKYCVTCHNEKAKTGGLSLEKLDVDHPAVDNEI
jgi:cytochrome c551/c552